jgi:hypothetical protein
MWKNPCIQRVIHDHFATKVTITLQPKTTITLQRNPLVLTDRLL